ncbi:MAG: hypothetical protein AAFQ89_17935 [Cyanobacteria bacterium J06626_18]
MPQTSSKRFQLRRVWLLSGGGLAALFLLVTLWVEGLHHYRVWKAKGVWCALGNDAMGWQRAYGEENCPEVPGWPNTTAS